MKAFADLNMSALVDLINSVLPTDLFLSPTHKLAAGQLSHIPESTAI